MNKPKTDLRNKPAFWTLAASQLAKRMPNSYTHRAEWALAKSWLRCAACPPLTESAVSRAAGILGVSFLDIVRVLTGFDTVQEARRHEARSRFLGGASDINRDGTYNRTCSWCERSFISTYANAHPTCADCAEGNDGYKRRKWTESGSAKEANYRRRALDGKRLRSGWHYAVLADFGYACAYCGMTRAQHRRIYRIDLTIDHIRPISGGWPNDASNMAPSCKPCNSGKGNKDLMMWASAKGVTPHPLAISKYKALANG